MAEIRRVRFLISGRVQGVGFRWATRRVGEQLEIAGWVRNLADGRVEVAAAGADDALARFVEYLRTGPPLARVDGLEPSPIPHEMELHKPFQVK